MIELATLLLIPTGTGPAVSMAQICEAHAVELLGSNGGVSLSPAARRSDGSWAITGTHSRPGAEISRFQCEIDAKGRFLGVARTTRAKHP